MEPHDNDLFIPDLSKDLPDSLFFTKSTNQQLFHQNSPKHLLHDLPGTPIMQEVHLLSLTFPFPENSERV